MKRRVVKVGDRRFRAEIPGGDVSEFSYREKARRWDPDQCSYVDFLENEDRYILSWEGIFLDTFRTEVEALLFIIRFGYSIDDRYLIPSEILADFNLVYEAGDWVDEWYCPDRHEVIFALGEISKPPNRKIRFEGYPRITPHHAPTYKRSHSWEKYEVVAEVQIPKLDFDELEKPKQRRRRIERNWSDPSDPSLAGWLKFKMARVTQKDRMADEDCVFTLKSGNQELRNAKKPQIPHEKETLSAQKS